MRLLTYRVAKLAEVQSLFIYLNISGKWAQATYMPVKSGTMFPLSTVRCSLNFGDSQIPSSRKDNTISVPIRSWIGTLYLRTFVLSIPYLPLNATLNSISSSLPLPSSHPVTASQVSFPPILCRVGALNSTQTKPQVRSHDYWRYINLYAYVSLADVGFLEGGDFGNPSERALRDLARGGAQNDIEIT